ncbi:hypothetical protein BV494_05245 [Rahnella sikkimica]|uniref:Uncharacterized protein n=2 Tax=Rahnella sikkimica TaxID=1805933 RepID=A0A2L1UWM2_9GAMM|nr:hypothetical protein BV494_05245 [Rahnella sikkimica]
MIMFTTFFGLASLPVKANDSSVLGKACKAAVASVFGRDHKSMKLDKIEGDVAFVHYIRSSDHSLWAVKCKLDGDRVIWASNNPDDSKRWRTDPLDDVVKYSIEDTMLTITQEYTDGSSSNDEYKLSGL